MKRFVRRPSPAMVVAIAALIVALGGTAVAGGVLNKKKVKNIANNQITSRAPGLSVASAKNADAVGGVPSTGFLSSSGNFQQQVDVDGFLEASGPSQVKRFTNVVDLRGTAISTAFFNLPLDVPSLLQGRSTKLNSVVLCYDASTSAVLDLVIVELVTNATGSNTDTSLVTDDTNRTDATCRTYAPSSPVGMGPNDNLKLVVKGDYTVANADLEVTRATVNLST